MDLRYIKANGSFGLPVPLEALSRRHRVVPRLHRVERPLDMPGLGSMTELANRVDQWGLEFSSLEF